MADRTVAVITDSVCGLDSATAADFGVFLLPVRVTTPTGTYADGRDFGPDHAIDAILAAAVQGHRRRVMEDGVEAELR